VQLPWRRRHRKKDIEIKPQLRLWLHIMYWMTAGIIIVSATLIVLWLTFKRPSLSTSGSTGTVSPAVLFDALKVALGALAGVGGVVALVVGYRKQRVNESQDVRDSTRLANERFAKASDQLGSEIAAIRLAGVYAMAALADDWPEQRQTCIDVLCAYIRMPYPLVNRPPELSPPERTDHGNQPWRLWLDSEFGESRNPHEERQVRLTIQRVIKTHLQETVATNWFGYTFDFEGSVFEGAEFAGSSFIDCFANFNNCLFYGESGFSECRFIGSRISFLNSVACDRLGFEYAYVEDSELILYFYFNKGCHLNLQGIHIRSGKVSALPDLRNGASLSLISSHLEGGEIEFHRLNLSGEGEPSLAFSRAALDGAKVTVTGDKCESGTIWLNGLTLNSGSLVLRGDSRFIDQILTFQGTEISMDGMGLNGGTLSVEHAAVDGSKWHIDNLDLGGGRVELTGVAFKTGKFSLDSPTISEGTIVIRGAQFSDSASVDLTQVPSDHLEVRDCIGEPKVASDGVTPTK
jgi:hypothetical protein